MHLQYRASGHLHDSVSLMKSARLLAATGLPKELSGDQRSISVAEIGVQTCSSLLGYETQRSRSDLSWEWQLAVLKLHHMCYKHDLGLDTKTYLVLEKLHKILVYTNAYKQKYNLYPSLQFTHLWHECPGYFTSSASCSL